MNDDLIFQGFLIYFIDPCGKLLLPIYDGTTAYTPTEILCLYLSLTTCSIPHRDLMNSCAAHPAELGSKFKCYNTGLQGD